MEGKVGTDQQSLETAVAQIAPSNALPRQLFEAAVQFLTYYGESAVLSAWVRDVLMAEGRPGSPHVGKPEVTVIIPCHNYGKYLNECVQSVLCQSFRAWEIIIINDGSTDATHEVVQELLSNYPEHTIRYYQQECQGIVQPRNRGATLACGEFILPLDADDIIAPNFLEKTVAVLRNRPELGYVSTKALFFGSVNKIWPAQPFYPLALLVTNQQTNTTLYRKRMWQDVGGYDERMIHGYMDWEFWIRCTKKGWMGKQLNEPLFFYRRKLDSVVMRAKKRDSAIKEQIIRLHPELYDLAMLPQLRDALQTPNWIPPELLRNPLPIHNYHRGRAATELAQWLGSNSQRARSTAGLSRTQQALKILGHILPEFVPLFQKAVANDSIASNKFHPMAAHFLSKVRKLLSLGSKEKALEMSIILVSAHPLEPEAIVLLLQTLAACGKLVQALEAAKYFCALLAWPKDVTQFYAACLHAWAQHEADPYFTLGLLEGAALLAPHDGEIVAALAEQRARLRVPCLALEAEGEGPAPIWYVTDGFGYGVGGVNGVSQAKSMTLSSLLQGADGRQVCVVLPLRPELPEAMAEFARHLHQIFGEGGFHWPRWVATIEDNSAPMEGQAPFFAGSQQPVCPAGPAPACLVVEGVRLEAHDYLELLHLPRHWPRVFVHHTSPDQFRNRYTDTDVLPNALRALKSYKNCVCVSANVMEEWRQLDGLGDKIWTHIPNCAREDEVEKLRQQEPQALRRALQLPDTGFLVLCLASVQWRKGQDILLAHLAEVLHHLPDACFIFVGPILHQWGGRAIVDTACRQFSTRRVQFLGARKNALEYVQAMDCLVLPSREEALPLTILEAMAMGKPCVASDVNGIPELVEPGITGLLFSHTIPRDLAKYLIRLGQDADLRRVMGAHARQRYVNHFARVHHVRRWRMLLADITSATPAAQHNTFPICIS
jgi:glycosyltransferase involved in cell wall biosynthesis